MGKTAELFDAGDLELGATAPNVDPDRVPAAAPAGTKEKKRRRKVKAKAKAKEAATPRGDASPQTPSAGRGSEGRRGTDAGAAKPSRKKRGGKTRVHAEVDEASAELLTAAEARRMGGGSQRAAEGRAAKRGADGRGSAKRGADGRGSAKRGSQQSSTAKRGADASRRSGKPGGRDAWRNYDEPQDRRGRGGRADRGARASVSPRGGRADRGAQASRSGRRPGDRGGRR